MFFVDKNQKIDLIIILWLSFVVTCNSMNYTTTQPRDQTVTNHCSASSRQSLYNTFGTQIPVPYSPSLSNFFNINTSLIQAIINSETNTVKSIANQNAGKFVIFFGPWLLGLAITLFIWPFLLCCCICPWSCPLWNTKRQNMPYTKCQAIWPAIVILILLLLVIVTSIIGISSPNKINNSWNDLSCTSGIVLDDVINGNSSFTDSNQFFSGVRTIYNQFNILNSQIGDLNIQIGKLGSNSVGVNNANTQINSGLTLTSSIPNVDSSQLVLTYSSPLESSSPSSSVPSGFPSVLGTSTANPSLVYAAYSSLTIYQSVLSTVSKFADNYLNLYPSFATGIDAAIKQLDSTSNQLQLQDKQLNNFINTYQGISKGLTIGQYVIYGVLIGMAVCAIIATSFIICGNTSCRHFIYFTCVLIFFLCILSFIICLVVSILNPVIYYSCQFITSNLQSSVKLQSTLINTVKLSNDLAPLIAQCIAVDGNGDMITKLIGTAVTDTLNSLNSTFFSLNQFTANNASDLIAVHQLVKDKITLVKQAQLNDISDQSSLNELLKLSNASQYICSSTGFNSDSWIPSISQNPVYVPCSVNSSLSSNSASCTSSSNFNSRATGCVGCMDSYDLFKTNTSSASVLSALNARYPSSSCATFNSQLSNVWQNFYNKKQTVLTPVQNRASSAVSQSQTVASTIPYFITIQQNIQNQFSSLVSAQYGMLNGLSCRTISQDVQLLRNVVCKSLYNYTAFTRIIFGIISIALLFLLCFITCLGHRQAKLEDYFRNIKYHDDKSYLQNAKHSPQNVKNNPSAKGMLISEMVEPTYFSNNQHNNPYGNNQYKPNIY